MAVINGVFILIALTGVWYSSKPVLRQYGWFQTGLREWHYPVKEAQFILEQKLPGQLFNTYGIGGYLMWQLYPDYLVFWDGRQDSQEMFKNGLVVQEGQKGWDSILYKNQVNLAVVEILSQADGHRFKIIDRLQSSSEWSLVFAGETHLVFVRDNSVDENWLLQHRLPESRIGESLWVAANHMLQQSPLRKEALWEMGGVYLSRRQHREALQMFELYIKVMPPTQIRPFKREIVNRLRRYLKRS